MVICYRKKMLRLAQIWFYGSREEFRRSGKEEAAMAKKADIAFYHGIREPESGPFCLKQTFHSRFSDLTLPEETLFLQISKTGRNEVRRSEKDGAEREFFDSGELLERPEILEGLAEMYRRMYASKGKEAFMNLEQMRALCEEAGDMGITLHRAFDVCRDPYETMEQCVELGIDTILTSGQKSSAWEGRDLIAELVEKSAGRIEILAGAGINAETIEKLIPYTKASAYHMSGKIVKDSRMEFRKEGVPMGIPGFSEFEIWQTDAENIRQAVETLKGVRADD